jgi:TusA-related sulfurtransferase
VIEVLSSDEGSKTDVPAWIQKAGHELVEVVDDDGFRRFVVKKAR